jgi:hypothetical protein
MLSTAHARIIRTLTRYQSVHVCLLSHIFCLCFFNGADFARFGRRLVSIEVLHNAPDGSESFHSAFLIEKVVPLRALQLWTPPVFFEGCLLGHGSCGQIFGVGIVDGEFENADVVEQAGDQENLCDVSRA